MWTRLKKFYYSCSTFRFMCYLLSIVFFLILPIYFLEDTFVNLFDLKEKNGDVISLSKVNSYAIVFLTLIIVSVAWLQFGDLNKTNKGDFLLRIDDRFGHETIIKARTLIHTYYCQTWKEELDQDTHRKIIGEKIKAIMLREDCAEDFTYLLNFLGFLEAISYFTNKNYISETELKELMGGSLPYYYDVYKPFINYRRDEYNQNYYCQLETLVNKINMT